MTSERTSTTAAAREAAARERAATGEAATDTVAPPATGAEPAGEAPAGDQPVGGGPAPAPVPVPEDAPGPEGPATVVEYDLEALLARAAERDEYLALAQRAQADFDNYRKRMTREATQAADRGVARLAKELLPALDHLDLALQAAERSAEGGELVKGIRLVQEEIVNALRRVGIEPFSPKGDPFDPSEHEAMLQQPSEGAESGTVIEVYQQGYRLSGTILRPARVVVAA